MYKIILITVLALSFNSANAQEAVLLQDKTSIIKAEVVEVLSEETRNVPGTDVKTTYQSLKVKILEGDKKGTVIDIKDDYLKLEKGDVFLLNDTIRAEDKVQLYTVFDSYRLPSIIVLTVIFVVLTVLIGGIQGIRGLLSLAGSLLLIMYVLIPSILDGYSPIVVSMLVSSMIIVLGSYITHGFNKTTTSAVFGMLVTIAITGTLAYYSVDATRLTGFESEESVYLNLSTRGSIDMVGILLSGIMIGLLGVLYDVAIGQAISVEELHHIAPNVSRKKVFKRALRMGREHIGALVDTLAIAYVGASLPLLLLFSLSENTSISILNREIFAVEIIRTLIGSIGLILAVPITTAISVWMIVKIEGKISDEEIPEIKHIH